jgi:hypothetical protein
MPPRLFGLKPDARLIAIRELDASGLDYAPRHLRLVSATLVNNG